MLIASTNTRLKGYNSSRKTHEMDIIVDQLWLNARLNAAEISKRNQLFFSILFTIKLEYSDSGNLFIAEC